MSLAPIPQPENSISITDSEYGAKDGQDSTVAFEKPRCSD